MRNPRYVIEAAPGMTHTEFMLALSVFAASHGCRAMHEASVRTDEGEVLTVIQMVERVRVSQEAA